MAKKRSTNAAKKINKQLDKLLKEKRSLDDTVRMPKVNIEKKNTGKTQKNKNPQPKKKTYRKKDGVVVEERKKVSKKKESIVVIERDEKEDLENKDIIENDIVEEAYLIDDKNEEKDSFDANVSDSKTGELYDKIAAVIDAVSDEDFIDEGQDLSLTDVIVRENVSVPIKEKKRTFLDIIVLILFVIFAILFIVFSCFIVFVCTY